MNAQNVSAKLGRISSALAYLGSLSLFGMMCITTVDVIGRYMFNAPIVGAFELTQFLVLILIFSFLPYTQSQKGHVSVDLLISVLPGGLRRFINIFNHTICVLLLGIITWMGLMRALEMLEYGEETANLGIPYYPFVIYLVIGCLAMCIEYIRDLMAAFFYEEKESSVS
ncbi:MAG: TRAP transporter small permease [Deltaproteobacteria bacterium]|nr:TRAP transporter small permease [Deltaproteobacteria bacterium]